jgi:tetratricopeptide (TPR) repeat protein
MDPHLRGDRILFGSYSPRSNPYRIMIWFGLILAGLWLVLQVERGEVEPLLQPAPTPTRTTSSYIEEGQALFAAGKLTDENGIDAIEAYQEALRLDPTNVELWTQLARTQTYSSSLLGTDEASLARMEEAQESIEQALALAPDDSTVHAVRALVLDWKSSNPLIPDTEQEALLSQAKEAAVRALTLDPKNTLALTYYAEVLLDQQNWLQAQQTIEDALEQDPSLMDVHRVYAAVLESLGQYRDSISEYERAAEINPNLTFLYIRIGYTYRHLQVYDEALDYFARAASINEQLGVRDPAPYLGIAKTYTQQGQFFVAAINAEKALAFNPANADTYGQLGIIYVKSRNFEGALPVLKCSVEGCTADENEIGGVDVRGQPLTATTLFYYLQYGSVLAALDECAQAIPVLDQVEGKYPDDTVAMSIVQENRTICRNLQGVVSP